VSFLAAFAAGLVVGVRWESWRAPSLPSATTRPAGPANSWLALELGLSADQREKMHRIWSETLGQRHEREERRRQLSRERDEALAALFGPENQARYEELQNRFLEQRAALDREGQESFQRAVDQTKQILNAQQREKYETILKDRRGWRSQGGGPGGERGPRGGRDRRGRTHEHGRSGGDRATSRPASAPGNEF
jgi:Spy/CpxP family protein refolding chaperone